MSEVVPGEVLDTCVSQIFLGVAARSCDLAAALCWLGPGAAWMTVTFSREARIDPTCQPEVPFHADPAFLPLVVQNSMCMAGD